MLYLAETLIIGRCCYSEISSYDASTVDCKPSIGTSQSIKLLPTSTQRGLSCLRDLAENVLVRDLRSPYITMDVDKQSSLLSTHIASDSDLHVALHPLVLLSISDYITRHTLRQQSGPVVGALLGQQTSRGITIEHAFECLLEGKAPDGIVLHQDWFEERLKQSKYSYLPRGTGILL